MFKSQTFTTPGASVFNVPAGVSAVLVTLMAGGGGGGGARGLYQYSAGGGGAGELMQRRPYAVTPGGTVALKVGDGGIAGIGVNSIANTSGGSGGDTEFGDIVVKGGIGGQKTTSGFFQNQGGQGGGIGGGTGASVIPGAQGTRESLWYWGG